jgi:hypothetical protein
LYLQAVYGLAKHYTQSPEKMTKEMIEDYLLYLKKEEGKALTSIGSAITGLRFFYSHVLGDERLSPTCTFAKTPESFERFQVKKRSGASLTRQTI